MQFWVIANGKCTNLGPAGRLHSGVAILGADWEPGGDDLTPTSKLRRKPIHEKYATTIDALYAG